MAAQRQTTISFGSCGIDSFTETERVHRDIVLWSPDGALWRLKWSERYKIERCRLSNRLVEESQCVFDPLAELEQARCFKSLDEFAMRFSTDRTDCRVDIAGGALVYMCYARARADDNKVRSQLPCSVPYMPEHGKRDRVKRAIGADLKHERRRVWCHRSALQSVGYAEALTLDVCNTMFRERE